MHIAHHANAASSQVISNMPPRIPYNATSPHMHGHANIVSSPLWSNRRRCRFIAGLRPRVCNISLHAEVPEGIVQRPSVKATFGAIAPPIVLDVQHTSTMLSLSSNVEVVPRSRPRWQHSRPPTQKCLGSDAGAGGHRGCWLFPQA